MNRFCWLIILGLVIFGSTELYSQKEVFIVKKVPFSSGINDEFSPVFYRDGIVYCSNQRDNSLIVFKGDDSRLFNMFFAATRGKTSWSQPSLFSKELKTGLNIGPATFNQSGSIMYFNRNNLIVKGLKNVSDTTNKLGIFSAELIDGMWTSIKPLALSAPFYTYCTPSLSPDGKRLFFSSDMPGGYGGMDLYYCDSLNTGWSKPINMGPAINTTKSESFPFAAVFGKLFFASDGHNGFGGKDIYSTIELNGEWIDPVHLDSALNSPFDDFGLVADSAFTRGFFSTNRLKTDDIFSFSLAPEEFSICDSMISNNHCFTFFDERQRASDTIPPVYIWDFGNGLIKKGQEVSHCFPGPGEYTVSLSIIDKLTGDTISNRVNYDLKLDEKDQPGISALNIGVEDEPVNFKGIVSGLKDFGVTGFFWDFGNGFIPGGDWIDHSFSREGEYLVKLGLKGVRDSLGNTPRRCVMRKIRIYKSSEDAELFADITNQRLREDEVSSADEALSLRSFEYLMNDLSRTQKDHVKSKLNAITDRALNFERGELSTTSKRVMVLLADVLKSDGGLRLEILVHTEEEKNKGRKMSLSEQIAQELGFRLKLLNVDEAQYGFAGSDSEAPFIIDSVKDSRKTNERYVELIFMKK